MPYRRAGSIPSNEFTSFGADMSGLRQSLLAATFTICLSRCTASATTIGTRNQSSGLCPERNAAQGCRRPLRPDARASFTDRREGRRISPCWLAAVERLTSPRSAGGFLPVAELSQAERRQLFDRFMRGAKSMTAHNIPVLLDATWPEIEAFTESYWRILMTTKVEIVHSDLVPSEVACPSRCSQMGVPRYGSEHQNSMARTGLFAWAGRFSTPSSRIRS